MGKRRMLILSSDTAGGHRYVGEALAHVAEKDYHVELIDLLALFGYPAAKSMLRVYPWIVNHAAWLWGLAFHLTNSRRRYRLLAGYSLRQLKPEFLTWLKDFAPDVIVSVYPHFGEVVAHALSELKLDVPFLVQLTDMETVHASWFHPRVDNYLVPTEECRINTIKAGVPISKSVVTGLPVRSFFTPPTSEEKIQLKTRLGLAPLRPAVLVTGGGTGQGIKRLVHAFKKIEQPNFQMLVNCGKNSQLYQQLLKEQPTPGLLIHSYTENMAELVRAADIVVGKAGPNTIMEAMACGVPIILTGKIPGQEQGNIDFVQRHKSGALIKNPKQAMQTISHWLTQPGLYQIYCNNARQAAQPEAATQTFKQINRWVDYYAHSREKSDKQQTIHRNQSKKLKILFISSAPYKNENEVIKRKRLWFPALTLPLLAGLVPPHWEVEILYEMIEAIPWETDADLIGIGSMGLGLRRSIDIADRFRALGKKVIIGGTMVSLAPPYASAHADSLLIGEADELLPQLLEDFEAGQLKPVYQAARFAPLIKTPLPRYDLVRQKKTGWWLPAQIGRGCPHRCDFCSVASLSQGHYRPREISEIIRDIRAIKALGYNKVFFVDDNIAAEPDFTLAVMKELQKEKIQWVSQCALTVAEYPELLQAMARSGCVTLSFGIESINQPSLDGVHKTFITTDEYIKTLEIIRSYGIEISTEMMVGLDGDTPSVFEETLAFLMKNKIALPRVFVLTPVPGTPLFSQYQAEGRIIEHDLYKYSATQSVFQPRHMSLSALNAGYWQLNDKLFSFTGILQRTLSPGLKLGLSHTLFLIISNLSYRQSIKERLCPGIV